MPLWTTTLFLALSCPRRFDDAIFIRRKSVPPISHVPADAFFWLTSSDHQRYQALAQHVGACCFSYAFAVLSVPSFRQTELTSFECVASHAHADAPWRPSSAAPALTCIISPTVTQSLTNSPWAWLTKLLFCSSCARRSIHEACARACKQVWAVASHLYKGTRFKMLGGQIRFCHKRNRHLSAKALLRHSHLNVVARL